MGARGRVRAMGSRAQGWGAGLGAEAQTKALMPVAARPTMREFMSRVPSYE